MSNRSDFTNRNTVFTGTDGIVLPKGTTGERPSGAVGQVRFNTELAALENYTPDGWFPVSVAIPNVTAVTGTIFAGQTSTLTLTGTNFGITAGSVRFTASDTVTNVTVTPASASSATVAVPSAVFNLSAGTTVNIQFINSDNGVSNIIARTVTALPTGGTIQAIDGFRVHTFTSSSSLIVPAGFSATAEYLVVAGGGGGGCCYGGGGGGGGVRIGNMSLSSGSVSVTIGPGGLGAAGSNNGSVGSNSSFDNIIALGGGFGGGQCGNSGGGGGSGGGGSQNSGGPGTSGQGNNGGTGGGTSGGGGGGAAGAGGNGSGATGGNGGNGALNNWRGSNQYYGAGAGGQGNPPGSGGLGGVSGFNGDVTTPPPAPTNSGAGGSGNLSTGATNGGNGGSGIVIIRYIL